MRFVGLEMIRQAQPDEKQPFVSHLQELRQRIMICLVTVGIAFLITYYFREGVNIFLLLPFKRVMPAGSSFIFTGVTEAFITYFKIWIITAATISSPVIIYQVWMFISPGLYEKEKKICISSDPVGHSLFCRGRGILLLRRYAESLRFLRRFRLRYDHPDA